MKIGIVTFHRAHNCGAALQCAALVSVLRRMGHEVKVVDNNDVGETRWPDFGGIRSLRGLIGWFLSFIMSIDIAIRFFYRYRWFRQHFMPMTQKCFDDKPQEHFDMIVVGSDQVLNPAITKTQTGAFLLEKFGDETIKCCYAASFGVSSLPLEYRYRFSEALSSFSYLGFRESSALQIFRNELGLNIEAQTVLDPTLLLDANDYLEYECPVHISGRFVVVYCDNSCKNEARLIAERIARKSGLVTAFIDQYRLSRFKMTRGDCIGVSPQEFLWLMRNAEYVVTTSFHGTAFSLINHKRFVVIRPHHHPMNERVSDLLGRLGIPQQIVFADSIPDDKDLNKILNVDYTYVYRHLSVFRGESLAFLEKACCSHLPCSRFPPQSVSRGSASAD